MNPFQDFDSDALEQRRRMRARRRQLLYLRRALIILIGLALVVLMIAIPVRIVRGIRHRAAADADVQTTTTVPTTTTTTAPVDTTPAVDEDTVMLGEDVDASYAVLYDMTDGRVVAAKQANAQAFPASITKVMTMLVAVENIDDFYETYTMSYTFINPLVAEGATRAGFVSGEEVCMTDLLYGCILPSGADATIALANHIAGDEDGFAVLMNEKAQELGLKNTHFTNTSGLHAGNHYTSALDMALIMAAAMENDVCREVLSAPTYTTAKTPQNPEGLTLVSTLFKRLDQSVILAGKTGWTPEAQNTLVSYAKGADGHEYVFVTMKNGKHQSAVDDAYYVYKKFCGITA